MQVGLALGGEEHSLAAHTTQQDATAQHDCHCRHSYQEKGVYAQVCAPVLVEHWGWHLLGGACGNHASQPMQVAAVRVVVATWWNDAHPRLGRYVVRVQAASAGPRSEARFLAFQVCLVGMHNPEGAAALALNTGKEVEVS